MAKGTDFMLKLLDRLSGPARQMERALKVLGKEQKAVRQATNQTEAAVSKMGFAARQAGSMAALGAAGLRTFTKAAKEAELAALRGGRLNSAGKLIEMKGSKFIEGKALPRRPGVKFKSQTGAGGSVTAPGRAFSDIGSIRGIASSLMQLNTSAGEAMDGWSKMAGTMSSTPLGMLASGVGFLGGKILDLGKYMLETAWGAAKLTYALGAVAAAWFTKEVLEGAIFMERASNSFEQLTGSSQAGAAAFATAKQAAYALGASVEETSQSFIDLLAAQFSVGESDRLVKLSADLATVTGHADAAGRAVYAITKIKSTGKLQGDELMMLAEAGLSLDLVYTRLEKRFGKTRDQILKMQQAGKIDAVSAIEAIEGAIMDKVHESKPGEAAASYAFKTFGGAWKQLQNAPKNFLLKIGERIDTGPLRAGMEKIVKAFSTADGGRAVAFVDKMVVGLGRALSVLPHFAEGFGESFDRILKALSFGDRDYEGGAKKAGKWLGEFFARSIEFAKRLAPVLEKMFDSFTSKMDLGTILDRIEKMDFSKLAEDFVNIAAALGKIANFAARLVGAVGNAPTEAYTGNTLDKSSTILAAATARGTEKTAVEDNPMYKFLEFLGVDDPASLVGTEESLMSQGKNAPPEAEPSKELASLGRPRNVTANVVINAAPGADNPELARLVKKSVIEGLQGVMDREVSEASV